MSSAPKHYPALDGLRGIAILLVVFLHNFGFMNYFFFGWLGVDLFFVLSGFLITNSLLNTMHKPGFLRIFYTRRLLRIFPLFYLLLIICLFILPAIPSLHTDISYYQQNQLWFWSYLQNWLFIFKEPYGDNMLLHTWSLAVEEQFYLVWPFMFLLVKKPGHLLMLAIAALLFIIGARYMVWIYQAKDLSYASLYTFTRIDGLCIGCIVSLLLYAYPSFLKRFTSLIVFLMAAVNFGFYFINNYQALSLPYLAFAGYTTFAVLFGILVHEAVAGKSAIVQYLLTLRVLKFFGKISYGLYIYHWPVYFFLFPVFVQLIADRTHLNTWYAETVSALTVTLIAILISMVSFEWFEKPILKLKNRYAV